MASRILLVEDDRELSLVMQLALEQAGYLAVPASTAAAAMRWLEEPGGLPDLVLADIGLPDLDMDGLDLCKALKRNPATSGLPVLVLTGDTANASRLRAAQCRADLVLHKPLRTEDLLAAVAGLLEAPRSGRRGVLHRGGFEVDPDRRTVFWNGKTVNDLGPRLFDLLYVLMEHWPHPLSNRQILAELKLLDQDKEVYVLVSRLRARLRAAFDNPLVETLPNRGYRLGLPVSQPS